MNFVAGGGLLINFCLKFFCLIGLGDRKNDQKQTDRKNDQKQTLLPRGFLLYRSSQDIIHDVFLEIYLDSKTRNSASFAGEVE